MNDLSVGFGEDFSLVLIIEHTDYQAPERNCATWATVTKDDAAVLAQRLGVNLRELPERLSRSVAGADDTVNATLGEVRDAFRVVLAQLERYRCRYRLFRRRGADGYACL